MWSFLWCSTLILGVVFVVLWRQLVLGKLYRVSTRESQTYTQLCWVVRLLGGDESRVQWVATKDRALAAGRKHKARIKKIEAELQERGKTQSCSRHHQKRRWNTRSPDAAKNAKRNANDARNNIPDGRDGDPLCSLGNTHTKEVHLFCTL